MFTRPGTVYDPNVFSTGLAFTLAGHAWSVSLRSASSRGREKWGVTSLWGKPNYHRIMEVLMGKP